MQKTILSTADVARLFDVTETTVKRWADEGTLKCQKTPGGHRKFEIKYVVEFAEENKFDPVGALEFMREEKFSRRLQTSVLSRDYLVLAEEFVERALSTDEGNIFAYLSYLYEHKIAPWEIFDRVIRAGMHEIGERWSRGEVGVDQEHRASYRTLQALARLQGQVLRKPPTGKSSLLACVGEEVHDIGLRCTSYIFDSAGWEVHYLGAQRRRQARLLEPRARPGTGLVRHGARAFTRVAAAVPALDRGRDGSRYSDSCDSLGFHF